MEEIYEAMVDTSVTTNWQSLETEIANFSTLPEFKRITDSIEVEKRRLDDNLRELNGSFTPIIENEHLWGLFKTNNYKDSIIGVYDRMRKFSQSTFDAINNTNSNLSLTLDLIKILARTEKDIYEIMDNNNLKIHDIADVIDRICKKNNIKDSKVRDVLEQTFQRSYTLRDRINTLKLNFEERLAYIDKHFENIQKEYEDKERNLTQIINDGKQETQTFVKDQTDKYRRLLEDELNRTKDEIDQYRKEAQLMSDELKLMKNELREELIRFMDEQNKKLSSIEERCLALENETLWEKAGMNALSFIFGLAGFGIAVTLLVINYL